MEYYFGDKNYAKDSYLQKEAKQDQEKFIELDKIMKFNKMRQLTKSREQVLRAIKDSKLIEISEDRTKVRKALWV